MFEGLDDRSPRAEGAPFLVALKSKDRGKMNSMLSTKKPSVDRVLFGNNAESKSPAISGFDPTQERRTLAEKIRGPSASEKSAVDPSVVLEAYVLALIEVYEDNMLALLDHLSGFPGAQLISAVIALFDCPTPPLFNPGIMDFIKSLTLPFCKHPMDIVSVRMENPFRMCLKISDILSLLFLCFKESTYLFAC